MTRYVPSFVRDQIDAIMGRFGADEHTREICTKVMYNTDLMGIDSHSISILAYYHHEVVAGRTLPHAVPTVVRDFGATALIDGGQGFGHPTAHLGMQQAIEKANSFGMGVAVVRDSNHFGAAGYYARMATDAGMMGITL